MNLTFRGEQAQTFPFPTKNPTGGPTHTHITVKSPTQVSMYPEPEVH